jgi:ATP-dependent Zn protease
MTGNNFHPEIIARIIELIRTGETDLRAAIRREYPVLTALGIERVLGIAHDEVGRENDLHHTATHESGHAVIARVLTLACGGATIVPDFDEGEAGHSITEEPLSCEDQWEKRGKVRGRDAVWHAAIIVLMAGAEAEIALLRSTHGGDTFDRSEIERMAEPLSGESWSRIEPRLRAMTRMLVRRHRVLIERVTAALIERQTLSGDELDDLVGRSVNDVKVNAPSLLVLHRDWPGRAA